MIETDQGEASINIELRDGIITVRHGSDNEVLLSTVAPLGSWRSIWNKLNSIKSSFDNQKYVIETIEELGVKDAMTKLKGERMI